MAAMVAVTQQPIKKTETAKPVSGQKIVPPQPKNVGADRAKAKSLVDVVGQGLKTTANVVGDGLKITAEAAVNASANVAKESLKGGLTSAVINFIGPIRFMVMSNPIGHLAARPLIKFLSPKLEDYLKANQIDLPVKPSAILNQVLFGDLEDMDGEVSKALDGFIDKALPKDVKDAINSGDIKKIAGLTATGLTSGTKGILNQLFNFEPGKSKFTSPFKFIGATTPLLNKLPKTFQPWAAGAAVLMFGGVVVRFLKWAAKLVVGGTLLAGAGVFGKKIFDTMTKKSAGGMHGDKSQGAMGTAMNMLSGLAGAGGGGMSSPHSGSHQPGLGNMLSTATNLLGMFGKK
jgi:hypothetical protein